MALISPIRGILRVPSHCLSMVLVNITHHAEGYIFLAHIIKEQDTTYLEFISLEVKSLNTESM
jgi:hypothetical protein